MLWLDVHLAIGPRNTLWKLITDLNRPFIFAGEDGLHIVRHLKNDGFNQLQWNSFRNISVMPWSFGHWFFLNIKNQPGHAKQVDNEDWNCFNQSCSGPLPGRKLAAAFFTQFSPQCSWDVGTTLMTVDVDWSGMGQNIQNDSHKR